MGDIFGDEVKDLLETANTNDTLHALSRGEFPVGIRRKYAYGNVANTAAIMSSEEPKALLSQPLFRYFLRSHLLASARIYVPMLKCSVCGTDVSVCCVGVWARVVQAQSCCRFPRVDAGRVRVHRRHLLFSVRA